MHYTVVETRSTHNFLAKAKDANDAQWLTDFSDVIMMTGGDDGVVKCGNDDLTEEGAHYVFKKWFIYI